jgi:DNA repair protein SbcC/Rad50
MWVERIVIEGFRGLQGTFSFVPGLTVVVGPNEAGKSSLHEALVRLFCGFSKSERRRNRGPSLRDRLAPWDGRRYALSGRLRDGDHLYDVSWDFETHTVQLTDERGRDLSHEVLARGDDVELGSYLFGVGPDDFRQVCCVDQDALLGVRQSPTLGLALQEAVANVAGDVTVEDAFERLNDFLRSVVGARIDNLAPSPRGRLNALSRERAELVQQLRESDEAREQLAKASAAAARLRETQDEKLRERETVRQRQLLSEAETLRSRLEEARRLAEAAWVGPTDAPELDEAVVDAVKSARDRLAEVDQELEPAGRHADDARPELERLEREQRRLVPLVDGLKLYAEVDSSRQADVQAAAAALAELADPGEELDEMPAPDPLLARYRAERAALLALTQPPRHPRLRRAAWIALVVLTLGLAHLTRKLVRHWRGPRSSPLAERLKVYGASSLAELDHRSAEEDARIARAEARAEARSEQLRATAARRTELISTLETALDTAAAPLAPLEQRVAAYLEACKRHTELTAKQAELERVRRELAETRGPANEVARLQRERENAERSLRTAYLGAGVEEPALDDAARRFDELLAAVARQRKLTQSAAAAGTALTSVLAGETLDALAARHDEALRQYEEHVAVHGDLSTSPGDPAQLARELAELEDGLRGQVAQIAQLETEAARLEEEVGDPAALKERLAAVEAEAAKLSDARDAVALARSVLREAADELSREFAPHLNDALRRNLARITGGRYSEARVDSDLSVKVIVPGSGQVVSADDLSRATKDQIFLVQRLEIAQLLAPTKGKAPLLLDDPFAHYDAERLHYGLEILAECAESRQVVLFTEDPVVASLALSVASRCATIELTGPVAVDLAGVAE